MEKAKDILEFYGKEVEIKKTIEELGELITAIAKGDRENITEEIADVCICINHICDIYDIKEEEIKKTIDFKINRQLQRMRKEKKI